MRRSVTVRRTAMVRTWISVLCVALHMLHASLGLSAEPSAGTIMGQLVSALCTLAGKRETIDEHGPGGHPRGQDGRQHRRNGGESRGGRGKGLGARGC